MKKNQKKKKLHYSVESCDAEVTWCVSAVFTLQLPGDGLQNMLLTFFSSRDYYHFASLPKKYLSLKCFSPWDHFLVSLPAAETIQCNCSLVRASCDWNKKNYVYNISVESLWREVTTRSGKHIYLNSSVILSLCFHEVSDSGIMCMWLLC